MNFFKEGAELYKVDDPELPLLKGYGRFLEFWDHQ